MPGVLQREQQRQSAGQVSALRLRIQEMTVEKRFEHLQKKQPWVFDLVDPKYIACYLGIPLSIFEKLVR